MAVLLLIFLYESDPRRDHQQIVLYSFCRSMRLLFHLAVKILLQIFQRRFEHVGLTYICRLYFSRMPAGPHFVTQPILLSENIPNIWHKSSTKNTRRSDQIETIKTIMQTTRPRITWKVLPMAQVAIFKEIFDHAKRFRLWIVLFWTKTSQRLTLYLLSSYR